MAAPLGEPGIDVREGDYLLAVNDRPIRAVAGHDPQLERDIQYCLEQLKSNPPKKPARPKYQVQR